MSPKLSSSPLFLCPPNCLKKTFNPIILIDLGEGSLQLLFIKKGGTQIIVRITYDPQSFRQSKKNKHFMKFARSCWSRHQNYTNDVILVSLTLALIKVHTLYHCFYIWLWRLFHHLSFVWETTLKFSVYGNFPNFL